jgi:protease-4
VRRCAWISTGVVVDERTQVDASSFLLGAADAGGEILLTDLIDSVDLARRDERIVALVLELDGLLSIGQSKTTELAAAIERFRAAGKPVVAVGDYFSQDQYRLAVEADTLLMHPFGAVAVEGYGYYVNYFAEALDKLSVTMNVFRAGDFKSIAEPFLRSDMSPGEREISQRWLDDLWRPIARPSKAGEASRPASWTPARRLSRAAARRRWRCGPARPARGPCR